MQRKQGGALSCRNPGRLLRRGAFRGSWAEKLTQCVHRTGNRRPEAQKLRQESDHRGCTRTDPEARREPSSSRITSARDSLPGQAQSHRTPCPSSPRAADPRKSLRDSWSGWCSSALLSRALWPAAYPASGFSPRACCLPRTHCPRELRRLAWNNATVQKRRPNTLGSQDQEFSGRPTDYFRSLVPTLPLAPSPEPPATSPRRCTLASGGEWG